MTAPTTTHAPADPATVRHLADLLNGAAGCKKVRWLAADGSVRNGVIRRLVVPAGASYSQTDMRDMSVEVQWMGATLDMAVLECVALMERGEFIID